MNKSVFDSGAAFEKYVSVTNSSKRTRDLAKKFVSNINNWQIERNKTNRGFYTFSSTTPNASKLYQELNFLIFNYMSQDFLNLQKMMIPRLINSVLKIRKPIISLITLKLTMNLIMRLQLKEVFSILLRIMKFIQIT